MSTFTEILWPEDLPQSPLLDGWQETLPDNVIRSDMEQGPAKLRRRSTAASGKMGLQFLLSPAQCLSLDLFYTNTLQGGVKAFAFTHPRHGGALACRMESPPQYSPAGGGYCRVRLSLEILP